VALIETETVTHTEGHEHHHPHLVHHFESMEQQREAGTLGMWWFLLTEIMFFGGMFLAYTLYRHLYFDAFAAGSNVLNIWWGAFNTAVLIASSLTMALAVYWAQMGNNKKVTFFLLFTVVLGSIFLRVKYIEYHDKFEEHVFPAGNFQWPIEHEKVRPNNIGDLLLMLTWLKPMNAEAPHHREPMPLSGPASLVTPHSERGQYFGIGGTTPEQLAEQAEAGHVRLYFWIYFVMTGFHATHMVIGIGILLMLAWQSWKGKFSKEYHSYIELTGLYWHFVDIVWIFLFPLLYLVDRHL
jgi:cytochrome c oxidase subunit 3